ncbi:FGGY family carbohydrate kinase [Leifsonia sp. NPDC080035]|uniref:FGGY family carbohydrate kinase n=1 Tax=Leifsonia sp. NPDC080035 TaxID=3143936 RepID=A0AAU7GF96_9MICO
MTVPASSAAALGVDVGTTNTKVVLAAFGGDGVVHEQRGRTMPTPATGAELRDAVLAAIAEVAEGQRDRIVGIGIASMAETGALIGPDGEPRGSLLRWTRGDTRAADRLVVAAGAPELYAATGVPVAAKSPLAHWLTLADEDDPRLHGARWSGVDALVAEALTGEAVTDRTLAARTMAYRIDGTAESFDPDLLALAGLTPDRFPRVSPPGDAAGALSAHAAAALDLPAGLPVVVAGHDHAVGAWAAGVREPGQAADSVGTAEALYRVAADIPREEARRQGMSIAPSVDGRHRSLLAGNPTAGALVEWALRELLPGVEPTAALRSAEAHAGRPIEAFLLPYLRGRQSPLPDPGARVRAVPALPAEPGAALAAVFAGLALHLAWLDAEQTRILGPRHPDVTLLGGAAAANGAWARIKNRVLPGRLRPVAAGEVVAVGAAMLAAHRITGITTTLPLGSPEDAATTGDPALLERFVAAATHHEKEPA